MPTRLSFVFEGDRQLDRTLERFELGAADASPAFERMGDHLAQVNARQFSSEGAFGSAGWPPLSPRYATWKARRYPGKGILEATGDLKESLTQRPFGIDVVEAHMAVFGSGLDYGPYHQAGTETMPARPPIDLPESVRREWVRILQRWLLTGKL